MEKKLHPSFQLETKNLDLQKKTIPHGQIQNEFDPTPLTWLQSDVQQMKSTAKELSGQQEMIGESKLKINRLMQKVTNIEERLETLATEMRANYSKMAARVSEKTISETRLESFMEKHNLVIQNFERKMAQMTKLLEDYQNKIMISNAAVEDARREIAKLKRI